VVPHVYLNTNFTLQSIVFI